MTSCGAVHTNTKNGHIATITLQWLLFPWYKGHINKNRGLWVTSHLSILVNMNIPINTSLGNPKKVQFMIWKQSTDTDIVSHVNTNAHVHLSLYLPLSLHVLYGEPAGVAERIKWPHTSRRSKRVNSTLTSALALGLAPLSRSSCTMTMRPL